MTPFFYLTNAKGHSAGCVLVHERLVAVGILNEAEDEVTEEFFVEIGADPGPRFALACICLSLCSATAMGAALDAIGNHVSRESLDGDEAQEAFDVLLALAAATSALRAATMLPS